MRLITKSSYLRMLTVFFLFFVAFIGQAQEVFLKPENSAKSIEVKILEILKNRLNVKAKLQVMDAMGEDLRVSATYANGNTKTVVLVDTKIVNTNTDGVTSSQLINITSASDLNLVSNERLKLLEWSNAWNANLLPVKVRITKDQKILASVDLLITNEGPISEKMFIASYVSLVQIWPTIIDSLEKNLLVTK
jgi:hypothetical protein